MSSRKVLMASALTALLMSLGPLVPMAFGQAPDHLQDVEKRLSEKRAAAEAHRKQMEGIKDPDQLSVEMRRHFQMTEDMLALMLERKKLMEAHAPQGTSPAAPGKGGAAGKGQMGGGMQGGGMMQKEMGGMQGGMMEHGMMRKEMGGMKGGGTQPRHYFA